MRSFLVFLFAGMVIGSVWAAPVNDIIIGPTTLTNETLSTVKAINIQDLQNPTFGVVYVRGGATGVTGNITITLNSTFDGTTWMTQPFYDVNNITTVAPMTTKTLTTNQTYLLYIPKDALGYSVPIVAMNVTTNSGNLTNSANVTVYMAGER